MKSKRITKVTEKIYYYPATVSDARIDAGQADPISEMKILDPAEYSVYKRNGDFVFKAYREAREGKRGLYGRRGRIIEVGNFQNYDISYRIPMPSEEAF